MLSVLTGSSERVHHEEREQALLDMLHAGGMQYFDREHLVRFLLSFLLSFEIETHQTLTNNLTWYHYSKIIRESGNIWDQIPG